MWLFSWISIGLNWLTLWQFEIDKSSCAARRVIIEDYLFVRKNRPVPLCWRISVQRQQSGKRHILDQHFWRYTAEIHMMRIWWMQAEFPCLFDFVALSISSHYLFFLEAHPVPSSDLKNLNFLFSFHVEKIRCIFWLQEN